MTRKGVKRSACALAGVAVLATVAIVVISPMTASGSSAKKVAAGNGNVSSGALDVNATLAYWTPSRMAAATPVPAMSRTGNPPASAGEPAAPTGPLRTGPGWAPASIVAAPDGPAAVSSARPDSVTPPGCYHCAIPFDRFPVPASLYRTYPYSTVAKVFFKEGNQNFVCSGSTLYTNQVWTAGHCVADGLGTHTFNTNVLVCPSYNSGATPVGCWAATQLWTKTNWITFGSFEWDEGVIITATNGGAAHTSIRNVTGYLGFSFGGSRDRHYNALGYPQAPPFNGATMQQASSEYGFDDSDGNLRAGAKSVGMGNDLTGGSSGGPWVTAFSFTPGAADYITGHNDWKWNALPQFMNSPYLDANACSLINAAGRPC